MALGLEACLVSTSVDLGPGDLVSDALAGGVVEFLRGADAGSRCCGRVSARDEARSASGLRQRRLRLPAWPGHAERIWTALGAAAALKAAAAQAKASQGNERDGEATRRGGGVRAAGRSAAGAVARRH